MMDITVSAYRQVYHDYIDRKITREEFWERVKELDLRQPKLFEKESKTPVLQG